jgi:hypothetical protein
VDNSFFHKKVVCDAGVFSTRIVEKIRDRPDVRGLYRELLKYQVNKEAQAVAVVESGASVDADVPDADKDGVDAASIPVIEVGEGDEYTLGLTAETVLHFMQEYQCETDATVRDAYRFARAFRCPPYLMYCRVLFIRLRVVWLCM